MDLMWRLFSFETFINKVECSLHAVARIGVYVVRNLKTTVVHIHHAVSSKMVEYM